jgi:hypothetical protein
MAYAIKFADLTIDGIGQVQNELPSSYSYDSFARRDGGIGPLRAPIPTRIISLNGEYFGDTEDAVDDYFDTLLARLYRTGRGKLYLKDKNRYVNAHISGYNEGVAANRRPGFIKSFSFQMTCDDPFFYDGQTASALAQNVTSSPFDIACVNNGSFETPALIEVKALGSDITDIKIYNTTTGIFLRYAGTITAGATLSIDSADMSAMVNGGPALNLISGSLEIYLHPGSSNIRYEGQTTGVDINVVWLERWL